ncbi:hypothetical protein BC628DRAFT_124604 [Trametes gibbosa]|nr:hypothetical protein BC628DRAFT_124604 [Trametes gibbosa]
MESFFHVTVYNAVRMLCHNCHQTRVSQFLHDYFDDYTVDHVEGHKCGSVKRSAMTSRQINIDGYKSDKNYVDVGSNLWFFWSTGNSPGAPVHPLNEVFKTLLSWFGAYYTLQGARAVPVTLPSDSNVNKTHGFRPMDALRGNIFLPKTVMASKRETQTIQKAERESREHLESLAQNLETHHAMIKLLVGALKKKWPEDDRAKLDQIQTGSKRPAKASNDRPSKKSKITQ